ncbi:MAG: hypothetical protein ACOZCL_07195 [Bacillota bacterium]
MKIAELDAITCLLMKAGIPYDTSFSPGTRRVSAAVQLTIHISPTVRLVFVINLESGGSVFGGKAGN